MITSSRSTIGVDSEQHNLHGKYAASALSSDCCGAFLNISARARSLYTSALLGLRPVLLLTEQGWQLLGNYDEDFVMQDIEEKGREVKNSWK